MTSFIEVYDNALPQEFCQRVISEFNDNTVYHAQGVTGGGVDLSKKRSIDIQLNRSPDLYPLLSEIVKYAEYYLLQYFKKYHFLMIGTFGLTVIHPKTKEPVKLTQDNYLSVGEPQADVLMRQLFRIGEINAQYYKQGEGGYPYWHSEIFPMPDNEALHRTLLFMFYLNDVDEGGGTEFFYQKELIQPKAGRMVIAPAGFTHTHRGNIPVSQDKYILTSWVLFNKAEHIYKS